MAIGDQPASSTSEQITTPPSPAGSEGIISLPPTPSPTPETVPESVLARIGRLDWFLGLLLLVFAFLLGSFKASNSDLFLHLATGRLLAGLKFAFGTDPFSYASRGYWVNHSWLYDLGLYLLFCLPSIGGALLVAGKAALLTVMTWLMFRTGTQTGRLTWIPLACTFLAVLAASPRFLLQPAVFSMLFLALVLYLLIRVGTRTRWIWAVPVICALWVNLDEWFFLGPITVALFVLGEFLQGLSHPGEKKADLRTLGMVLLACCLACLLSPHHVHVFQSLPAGLLPAQGSQAFSKDPFYQLYYYSPILNAQQYWTYYIGLSAAGISFVVLLVAGLGSFVALAILDRTSLRWWRVLIFLAFAALACYNVRVIVFFAIVAGPIMALNFLELSATLLGAGVRPERNWQSWAVSGRWLTVLVALVLIVLSVQGRLQQFPHHRREVAWGIEVNEGLKRTAEQIATWRAEGKLEPGQHWYNQSGEVASYLAWFAPGEKTTVDHRLELFGAVADELRSATRSLAGEQLASDKGDDDDSGPDYADFLRKYQVPFLIVHPTTLTLNRGMQARLFSNPEEFVTCLIEGQTAVFAWRGPREDRSKVHDDLALDLRGSAFGKGAVKAPPAPARIPGSLPWWQALLVTDHSVPTDTSTAEQMRNLFDARGGYLDYQHTRQFVALLGSEAVGLGSMPGGPLAGGVPLTLRLAQTFNPGKPSGSADGGVRYYGTVRRALYVQQQDAGPVPALYLGIRSARQGLHEEPDDMLSQFFLAETYFRLVYRTRERWRLFGQDPTGRERILFPHARSIRQSQLAGALRYVLKVSTTPEQIQRAHFMLSQVFTEAQYLESRVFHLKEYLRVSKELERLIDSPGGDFPAEIKKREEELKKIDAELKKLRDLYVINSANKPLLEKVQIAISNGLADTALTLLLNADPAEMRDRRTGEAAGAGMAIELLLGLGRIDEAMEALTPDPKSDKPFDRKAFGRHRLLGVPAYEWFRAQGAAAMGNYADADTSLAEAIVQFHKNQTYSAMLAQANLVAPKFVERETEAGVAIGLLVGNLILREAAEGLAPWQAPLRLMSPQTWRGVSLTLTQQFLLQMNQQEADLWTVRGWLALEAGNIEKAREYVEKSISLSEVGMTPDGVKLQVSFRSRPLAALVMELLEQNQ